MCLWAAAEAKGYDSGEWATYQQWQERGAQVRKGEKATTVVFWNFANGTAESQDGDDNQPATGSRLLFTRGDCRVQRRASGRIHAESGTRCSIARTDRTRRNLVPNHRR